MKTATLMGLVGLFLNGHQADAQVVTFTNKEGRVSPQWQPRIAPPGGCCMDANPKKKPSIPGKVVTTPTRQRSERRRPLQRPNCR